MKIKKILLSVVIIIPLMLAGVSCKNDPQSTSGVGKATASVKTGSDGLTGEQRNIKKRVEQENMPGAIQYLYVIAPESGDVVIYSTVDGKVSSSGKRLSPKNADNTNGGAFRVPGIKSTSSINGVFTNEILGDDGTYGSSNPYIYWYDTRGIYHQHFFTGGQIIHVSGQPLSIGKVIINMELVPVIEITSK